MAKLKSLARQRHAVLRLSVHESASKVNRSGGDAQVVSCHRYLVVFHPFVEHLTVFHTSGLVLALSSISESSTTISMPCAIARWHPERHMPKGTTMHKPVYFNRKPIADRHTNIQAQAQTKAPLAPAVAARL